MMDPHTRMAVARLAVDERRRDADRRHRALRARRDRVSRKGTEGDPAGPVAAVRQGLATLAGGRGRDGARRAPARPVMPENAA
ncbi:MAG TPA: hypothetical protein VFZ77_12955 [Acidimicrobiales bacterium]